MDQFINNNDNNNSSSSSSSSRSMSVSINQIFNNVHGFTNEEVIVSHSNIQLKLADFQTLRGLSWLNDNIIDFYFKLLQERDDIIYEHSVLIASTSSSSTVIAYRPSYFFNAFFVTCLTRNGIYNYSDVSRWTRNIDIFSRDKGYWPLNFTNLHWALLVIFFQSKEIYYYDSLHMNGMRFITAFKRWLQDESMNKRGIPLNINEWRVFHNPTDTPRQENGSDCGVFVIMGARAIAYNQPLSSYNQSGMQLYRSMIGNHLLRNSLEVTSSQNSDINSMFPYWFDLPPTAFAAATSTVASCSSSSSSSSSSSKLSTKLPIISILSSSDSEEGDSFNESTARRKGGSNNSLAVVKNQTTSQNNCSSDSEEDYNNGFTTPSLRQSTSKVICNNNSPSKQNHLKDVASVIHRGNTNHVVSLQSQELEHIHSGVKLTIAANQRAYRLKKKENEKQFPELSILRKAAAAEQQRNRRLVLASEKKRVSIARMSTLEEFKEDDPKCSPHRCIIYLKNN